MASSKYIAGRLQKELLISVRNGIKGQKELLKIRERKDTAQRALKGLLDNKFLVFNDEKILLTESGRKALINFEVPTISQASWDGVWKIVSYDIPEEFKKERDYFRRKLIEIGFVKVQESLWLFPYDSREALAVLAKNLNLTPFIIYLTTDNIPNQSKYLNKFDLTPATKRGRAYLRE